MRVIIAGSRTVKRMEDIEAAVRESRFNITTVICGMARGADILGSLWAQKQGIPIVYYPADWRNHGKTAGILRNRRMLENADGLIAVWDGNSPGTYDMLQSAVAKIPIYLKVVI
jgi:hypothetical protein